MSGAWKCRKRGRDSIKVTLDVPKVAELNLVPGNKGGVMFPGTNDRLSYMGISKSLMLCHKKH